MNTEIKVPSMGESISEATIGQILAPSGSVVKADAEILELETDKVNQVLYAPQAGKINLTVKPGDTVKIGQTIGTIELSAEISQGAPKKEEPIPKKGSEALQAVGPSSTLPVNKKNGKISTDKAGSEEKEIRYTREDFISDLSEKEQTVLPVATQTSATLPKIEARERETRRPMSKIRKVIAQRLVEAQQTMAMLTTFNEVDLTHVIQLREKYKESFIKKHQAKLGFMSFFVKATVSALEAYPQFNSYLDGDEIVHREYYDIGVAVGTDKGVIVPVVRNCDQLSYAGIEQAIEGYAKKAKDGTLVARDLQGGGFTITNGGTYGSLLSTPILLPPQCGILGMHKIEKRPVVINDQITIRSMMYLALSYDHRLVDGKEAVGFLVHIKNVLEEPSRLLLDI